MPRLLHQCRKCHRADIVEPAPEAQYLLCEQPGCGGDLACIDLRAGGAGKQRKPELTEVHKATSAWVATCNCGWQSEHPWYRREEAHLDGVAHVGGGPAGA